MVETSWTIPRQSLNTLYIVGDLLIVELKTEEGLKP